MTDAPLPASPAAQPASASPSPPAPAERLAGAGMPHRLSPWFSVIGVLLLASVLAAAFVQARQFALLNMAVHFQDDYLVISMHQVEVEYLRLREQLRRDLDRPSSNTLQLRYDIFVSRVALLGSDRARRLITNDGNADNSVMRDIEGFIQRADLYLGGEAPARLSIQAAQVLLGELEVLDQPIHRMLLAASHRVAEQVTERQQQVRQHNRVSLALTGFLLAMVLLFGTIALQQLRKLERRRRRLEQLADQLRDARIEAEAASAAKGEFLADMSHELRTPLHGLLGMLALIKGSPRDPRAREWLLTADASAQHLRHLLDDLLDLSRLNAGTLVLAPGPVNLAALLGEVQALLAPAASAKGLVLQVDVAADLPACARLDPTRVRQVLYNLMSNAIKFSDHGAVWLQCRARIVAHEPAMLEFNVSDTGIGMDRDTVARLFRRYTQLDEVRGARQGSTGLGLAISRNLARLMGGELVVRSAPGDGSVFSLRCPLQALPDSAAALPLPAGNSAAALPAPAAPAARALQVLVAEDHPVNRLYLAALLARLGHQTRMVNNGQQAVDAAAAPSAADGGPDDGQAHPPYDLVLMDVHMPVMDGVAATEAIRALPGAVARVCVVAITADVFADTQERCKAAGVDELLTKPLSHETLQAMLARRFGQAGSAAAPALQTRDPVATDEPNLLDHATLNSVCDLMGRQQVPTLYGGFFTQAEDAARRMRDAMRDADPEALRRSAHTVKGAALNLGLPALAEAASLLSREAGSLAAAHLALAVQRFEEVTAATRSLCAGEGLVADASRP